jgi:hypothetical protein
MEYCYVMQRDELGHFVKGHNTPISDEVKKKISITCKKRGIGKWMIGKHPTKETRKKLSENNPRYWLGKKRGKQSIEWRHKIAIAMKKLGRKPSKENIERVANLNKGKFGRNHPGWVENKKLPLYKAIRRFYKYREWRTDIFTRDNFSCVLCGVNKVYLEADHFPKRFIDIIREYNIKTFDESIACKELWDINNGRTLCRHCHLKTPTWGKKCA